MNTLSYVILFAEDRSKLCQDLVENGILNLGIKSIGSGNPEAQAKGAELVAELAKVCFYYTVEIVYLVYCVLHIFI